MVYLPVKNEKLKMVCVAGAEHAHLRGGGVHGHPRGRPPPPRRLPLSLPFALCEDQVLDGEKGSKGEPYVFLKSSRVNELSQIESSTMAPMASTGPMASTLYRGTSLTRNTKQDPPYDPRRGPTVGS